MPRDPETHDHRRRRQREPLHLLPGRALLLLPERQVEREHSRHDEQVVHHLVMGTEQRQPHRKGEQRVALEAPLANGEHQCEKRQREQRAHEQLSVVPRGDERADHTGELIRHTSNYASGPADREPPEQEVREESGQHVVDQETEVHGGRGRQGEAQPGGGIEDVAVLGGNERQPTEDLGIPQRNVTGGPPLLRQPCTEGVAGGVLVAPGTRQELPREHGKRQDRHAEEQDPQRGEMWSRRFKRLRRQHLPPWAGRPARSPRGPHPIPSR
jgi:hypothetical protein